MGKRLTDKEKKKILSDYVQTQNIRETSRINQCSTYAVRKIINNDDSLKQKITQKNEENTKDMFNYLEEKNQEKKRVIDLCLKALNDKLAKPDMFTNVKDIATVYGIIIDKDLKIKELQINKENKADLSKVDELLKGIKDVAINK